MTIISIIKLFLYFTIKIIFTQTYVLDNCVYIWYNIFMEKVILHADLNNFYASVECVDHPEYKNLPLAVCGNPENRHGIILAKNNLAKALGVKTGEAIWEAQLKCRNLILISPHFDKYSFYSKLVRNIYYNYTDKIETFGLDECWLDVTGSKMLFGSEKEIADKIRRDVFEKSGLTISVGVSFSKIFAKLGSDMKKPDATTIISKENYKQKVWPLPVSELLFIGKQTNTKLKSLNILTIGDLANCDKKVLKAHFGIVGEKMYDDANGVDNSEILRFDEKTPVKSVGNGTTTKRDMVTNEDVRTVIFYLAETVASRLRGYGFMANGVSVSIRSNDLSSFVRQKKLPRPTVSSDVISKACYQCFLDNYDLSKDLPIRTLTISTYDLISLDSALQESIFFAENIDSEKKLGASLDKIREKFGQESVTKAAFIDNSLVGITHTQDDDTLPFQRGNREKFNS